MRFFPDSDLEIPVRWFFCDPGAKDFPGRTNFGSGNWDSVWAVPGLGEQLGARPWVDGSPPPWDEALPCSIQPTLPDPLYARISKVTSEAIFPIGTVGQLFTLAKPGPGPFVNWETGDVFPFVPPRSTAWGLFLGCFSNPLGPGFSMQVINSASGFSFLRQRYDTGANTGKKFEGPVEVYRDGVVFPGVPLNCEDDGYCVACGPKRLTSTGLEIGLYASNFGFSETWDLEIQTVPF